MFKDEIFTSGSFDQNMDIHDIVNPVWGQMRVTRLTKQYHLLAKTKSHNTLWATRLPVLTKTRRASPDVVEYQSRWRDWICDLYILNFLIARYHVLIKVKHTV
jgi:hypothetical protein